jgi:hypothetical protein
VNSLLDNAVRKLAWVHCTWYNVLNLWWINRLFLLEPQLFSYWIISLLIHSSMGILRNTLTQIVFKKESLKYVDETCNEEWCLLGCYAVWFLQEPHGVTTQKTPFFIVTAMKTSNLATCNALKISTICAPTSSGRFDTL